MKQKFILSLMLIPFATASHAAINWWEQATVCRLDPSKCYSNMGIGYAIDEWDSDADCRGKKIICGAALKPQSDNDWSMSKYDIKSRNGINPDFDIDVLNGTCFGARKTVSNGSQAYYNNVLVNVFCPGVLENFYDYDEIENVETGSILTKSEQPRCDKLATYGYVNVKNGRCYGKQYSESEYYIDCSRGDNDVRLVILNGAEYTDHNDNSPRTPNDADAIFDEMLKIAADLRK
ncbi:MAG: hypothetical protein IJ500_04185 [Alphaproteobacteria bacterium]|nr:hypothetical protein [Alphaproteobacteria bacterium]